MFGDMTLPEMFTTVHSLVKRKGDTIQGVTHSEKR